MINKPAWVECNASLYQYNTFRFDYAAQYLAVVESDAQLIEALAWAQANQLVITCLGGGSNLLLQGDVVGLVIINRIQALEVTIEGDDTLVHFGAGMVWHDCVQWAVSESLWGIENLALIPGTAGAAPVQNIGAYGVELKDVLETVRVVDCLTGELATFDAPACQFAYRESRFKHEWKTRYIIVGITLRLTRKGGPTLGYGGLSKLLTDTASLAEVFATVCHVRQSKLPDPTKLANAGSFFKNPIVSQECYEALKANYADVVAFAHGEQWKLAAGWLNERAGWKGHRQGNVGVYDKQALVLVNYADRKADGLRQLEADIQRSIKQRFGVVLEREPVLLGD